MKMRMKKVFVCSPLRASVDVTMEQNIERAKYWARWVAEKEKLLPIAPHLYFTQFLDDDIDDERARGIEMGMELLNSCDELWVFGERISKGMECEITHWRTNFPERPLVWVGELYVWNGQKN